MKRLVCRDPPRVATKLGLLIDVLFIYTWSVLAKGQPSVCHYVLFENYEEKQVVPTKWIDRNL